MRHVTFTHDMAPYRRGEQRLVPDDVAAQLEKWGDIEPNPPAWPARNVQVENKTVPRRMRDMRPRRDLLNGTYLTK